MQMRPEYLKFFSNTTKCPDRSLTIGVISSLLKITSRVYVTVIVEIFELNKRFQTTYSSSIVFSWFINIRFLTSFGIILRYPCRSFFLLAARTPHQIG